MNTGLDHDRARRGGVLQAAARHGDDGRNEVRCRCSSSVALNPFDAATRFDGEHSGSSRGDGYTTSWAREGCFGSVVARN